MFDTKAGAKVPNVKGHCGERHGKDYNERSSNGTGAGGASVDDTVLTDDADSFHVSAGIVVGVVDHATGELGFALSGSRVHLFAALADLIGILLVVLIIVVVVLFETRHAGFSNDGLALVREIKASKTLEGNFGEFRTGVISKETHVDRSSLLGAVRSYIVLSFFLFAFIEATAALVIVLEIELGAAHVVLNIELFASLFVIGIRVVVNAFFHASIDIAVVLAVLCVEVITLLVIIATVTDVVHLVLALVFDLLTLGLKVRLHKGVHIDNVVAVSLGATGSLGGRAGILGAETETDKTGGGDLDIFSLLGIVVPLLDVVASLELDSVTSDPRGVELAVVVLFDTTSLRQEVLAEDRVGRDFRHSRSDREESGKSKEGKLHHRGGCTGLTTLGWRGRCVWNEKHERGENEEIVRSAIAHPFRWKWPSQHECIYEISPKYGYLGKKRRRHWRKRGSRRRHGDDLWIFVSPTSLTI